MNEDVIIREATEEALRLHRNGVPFEQAAEWSVDLVLKRHLRRRKAMGETYDEFAKKGKDLIGPWTWVLSVLGFLMGVVNTNRIAKVYGSWRKGRAALKVGQAPGV